MPETNIFYHLLKKYLTLKCFFSEICFGNDNYICFLHMHTNMNKNKFLNQVKTCIIHSIFLPAVLLLITGDIHAQQLGHLWDVLYSHASTINYSSESRHIATDASGNIFVLADVTSDTDPNGIVTGSTHYYTVLLKYDDAGVLQNDVIINVNNHLISGFTSRGAFGLEIDNSDNVYVGYALYNASTHFDLKVSKYDNNLNLLWTATHASVRVDEGVSMTVNNVGEVFMLIKASNPVNNNFNYHILKASGSGNMTLLRTFELNTEVLGRLILGGTTHLYAVGYKWQGGFKSALTVKVTTGGTLVWKKIFDAGTITRDEYLTDVLVGNDGHVYAVGTADRGTPTNNDVMVVKHDAGGGKVLWARYLDNNNGNESGVRIITHAPNYLYIGANSGNSVFIEKMDYNGTTGNTGAISFGQPSTRFVYSPVPVSPHVSLQGASLSSMLSTANNRFYLAGTITATNPSSQMFSATFLIRLKEVPNARGSSIFSIETAEDVEGSFNVSYTSVDIALYAPTKSVYWLRDQFSTYANHQDERVRIDAYAAPSPFRTISTAGLQVSLHPNPVADKLHVSAETAMVEFILTDLSGRTIKRQECHSDFLMLDITGLATGLYLLQVYDENRQSATIPFVKQ